MGLIQFHYLDVSFRFQHRTKLKGFLLEVFERHRRIVDTVNYIFCNDDYLLAINQEYLNHDTLTDIITFEHSNKPEPLLADIFISIPMVTENASRFQKSFENELHRVIFHGTLHLCGYQDKKLEQAQLMRSAEDACLNEYFVPREKVNVNINTFPVKQ